jgi:hypothetical protein
MDLPAIVYCLSHVPPIANYVRDTSFETHLQTRRKNACDFARVFAAIVTDYWKGTKNLERLEDFASSFSKFSKARDTTPEKVERMLGILHDATKNAVRISDDDRPWPVSSAMKDALEKDSSIFSETCLVNPKDFVCRAGDLSVTRALDKMDVDRFPSILIISIQDDVFVSYEMDMKLETGEQYSLISAVLKHSSDSYSALCLHDTTWKHLTRDSEASVRINDVIQKDAHILFYMRIS